MFGQVQQWPALGGRSGAETRRHGSGERVRYMDFTELRSTASSHAVSPFKYFLSLTLTHSLSLSLSVSLSLSLTLTHSISPTHSMPFDQYLVWRPGNIQLSHGIFRVIVTRIPLFMSSTQFKQKTHKTHSGNVAHDNTGRRHRDSSG